MTRKQDRKYTAEALEFKIGGALHAGAGRPVSDDPDRIHGGSMDPAGIHFAPSGPAPPRLAEQSIVGTIAPRS